MGGSAWSWSSKGRATASVTGLALDGSTVTNDLELQALCLEPLESQSSIGILGSIGIPKLNWNLQGKACGHLRSELVVECSTRRRSVGCRIGAGLVCFNQ